MKSFNISLTENYFDYHKPNETIKNQHSVGVKVSTSTDNADIVINSEFEDESKMQFCRELEPTVDMNNSAMLSGSKESTWSYDNFGFRSLPVRGHKRNRRPDIKFWINSDTVSQTKKLIYKEHQKPKVISFVESGKNKTDNNSPFSSSDSLNSNNDPEFVAAIDQIASHMGLTENQMNETPNDSVMSFLKTRSFSERISKKKSYSFCTQRDSEFHSTANDVKDLDMSLQQNHSFSKYSSSPTTGKKHSKFSKILERLSPKLTRKSKSVSSTNTDSPISTKVNLQKNSNNNERLFQINPKSSNVTENTAVKESKNCFIENSQKNKEYFNDNSRRLLNSLKVDRIENLPTKFRTIAKKRVEENVINQVPEELCKIDSIPLDSPTICTTQSNSVPHNEHKPVILNSRYVNVSLSAFGYGAHQCVYKSPIERSHIGCFTEFKSDDLI